MTTARLFVAVWPDSPTRAVLAALPRASVDVFRPVPAENWHVTLRFLGDVDVDAAVAALADVALPAATAVLGPGPVLLDGHVVVPVSGVDELAGTVTDATRHLGGQTDRPFRGHLTVARRRGRSRATAVSLPPELDVGVGASFRVGEVALVRSSVDQDGARYATVATFATRPPQPG